MAAPAERHDPGPLTSTANPRAVLVRRLAKRRVRDESGRFVVEGIREVGRALSAGVELDFILQCPSLLATGGADILDEARSRSIEVAETSPDLLRTLSAREHPDGMLAVARTWPTGLDAIELTATVPLVLVVAAIEKPGNLGAMVRSAAAAAVDAVVVADPVVDVFNPNVVRASMGAMFSLPVAVADGASVRAWLTRHGVPIYATSPDATVPYWDLPLDQPAAVVIGAEDDGLGAAWLAEADQRVTIPMTISSQIDSLNASAAAAVVLFEAVRQRQVGHGPG